MELLHLDNESINKEKKVSEDEIKVGRIKQIMQYFNIYTIRELAAKTELSPSYLSEIMSGKKSVPKTLGQKIEDTLGINRKWVDSGALPFISDDDLAERIRGEKNNSANPYPQFYSFKDMDQYHKLSQNLKAVRLALGLSQKEFGEKIGYKQNTVSESEKRTGDENDKRGITLRYLDAVCSRLGVEKSFLETGEGKMFSTADSVANHLRPLLVIFETIEAMCLGIGLSIDKLKEHVIESDGYPPVDLTDEGHRILKEHLLKNTKDFSIHNRIYNIRDYERVFGKNDFPKAPKDLEALDGAPFEISPGLFSISVPLIYSGNLEYLNHTTDEDYLKNSCSKMLTTIMTPPTGVFRAFSVPDEALSNHTLDKPNIPQGGILIGRRFEKRFWVGKININRAMPYPGKENEDLMSLKIFVTKVFIQARYVRELDFKRGIIDTISLNPDVENVPVDIMDLQEIYDVVKIEMFAASLF